MLYSALRGDKMEIRKQLFNNETLLNSNPLVDFDDKRIISYVYLIGIDNINLHKHELDVPFMLNVFPQEKMVKIMNIYLNILNDKDPKAFELLKKENAFDSSDVLNSFSQALKDNYNFYGNVFSIIKEKDEEFYKDQNPLQMILAQPYMKQFCQGLGMNYREKVFFLLNLLNTDWGWLFPENEGNQYKINVVRNYLNVKEDNLPIVVRNLNNRMLQLGLFSEDWKVNDFVYGFFSGKNNLLSLKNDNYSLSCDCYAPDDIIDCNLESIIVWLKLLKDYLRNNTGCYSLLCGTKYFRLKNITKQIFAKENLKLYELQPEMISISKAELNFYIYTFSIKLMDQKSVLILPPELAKIYLGSEQEEKEIFHIINARKSEVYQNNESILDKVQIPVIICTEKPTPDSEIYSSLEQQKINLLFTLDIKLPSKDDYEENVENFFCSEQLPSDSLKTAIDFCVETKICPSKWKEISTLLRHTRFMSLEEIMLFLKNKYQKTDSTDNNIRKNSHYSLEALNTSEPVQEVVQAIKNAVDFQKDSNDYETGIRLLLSGPSGTGKTAYVEQTARMLNKPLSIIRASDILGGIVGETEQNIKKAFENAKKENAILLIDEADSFLHSRGDSVNRHNDLKVNEFLIQMERFDGILFCNTNLPEVLDMATDRRFHFKIEFKPLTENGVEMLCQKYFETFEISKQQINQIYSSGDVCPGDFGALYGKIRFIAKEKLNADYITKELCSIVRSKNRSGKSKTIGFNA